MGWCVPPAHSPPAAGPRLDALSLHSHSVVYLVKQPLCIYLIHQILWKLSREESSSDLFFWPLPWACSTAVVHGDGCASRAEKLWLVLLISWSTSASPSPLYQWVLTTERGIPSGFPTQAKSTLVQVLGVSRIKVRCPRNRNRLSLSNVLNPHRLLPVCFGKLI